MTRAELDHYACSKDLRLDLAAVCNSTTEIKAAKQADAVMQQYIYACDMARGIAPHNPTRHQNRFNAIYDAAIDNSERDLLLSEWRSLSPLQSDVKRVKEEALALAISILSEAKIGKKRIKKMIPILTDTLLDDDALPTEIPTTPNFLK